MCGICGCGDTGHAPGHDDHDHHHHDHAHDAGAARRIAVEQDILAENDRFADRNRRHFADRGIFAVNLLASPGAGKTMLLAATIAALRGELPLAVIEGDQQTDLDAARIRAAGAPARQVNTGRACHLDAHMIGHALADLPPLEDGILFIENVGNLVCPAGFDLGEAHKVVIVSVTEGEDKPLKYPHVVHAADLMLIGKTDLLPHLDCDVASLAANAQRVHPGIATLPVSAKTGAGLDAWLAWLRAGAARARRRGEAEGRAAAVVSRA